MFCVYTRPRNQVSVYRSTGPLVFKIEQKDVSLYVLIYIFVVHKIWHIKAGFYPEAK